MHDNKWNARIASSHTSPSSTASSPYIPVTGAELYHANCIIQREAACLSDMSFEQFILEAGIEKAGDILKDTEEKTS